MKLRHPEKINNKINPIPKKPKWIRVKAPVSNLFKQTKNFKTNFHNKDREFN